MGTIFITIIEHWTVISTAYCLQFADSQHSHCCCCPTNTLTAVHYTNSTTFVLTSCDLKLLVLLLHEMLQYEQNFLLKLREVTGCSWHSCVNACKRNSSTHCGTQQDCFFPAVTHCHWFNSSSDSSDQPVSYKVSQQTDHCPIVRTSLRHDFLLGNWGKKQ